MKILDETAHEEITALLTGRKVTKISDDELLLDNGTRLKAEGNPCYCCAGYDLTELNGVDNIITSVEFLDGGETDGVYKIFVYADNQKINLATFEGSDGSGYYGTGYFIYVTGLAV